MDEKRFEILQQKSKLSLDKQALLKKRLQGQGESNSEFKISRRSQYSPAPLSFAQARLLFLHQLDPSNPAYNELLCLQLLIDVLDVLDVLDVRALEQSINEIVRRHESLRTNFKMLEGEPVQIIHPRMTVNLPVVDLHLLSEVKRQVEIERLTTEFTQKPFDLAFDPLLRVMLIKTSEQEHLLVFVIHHIIYDVWSVQVLVRELKILYTAFHTGQSSPLPELSIQYADFAIWQRQWLQDRQKNHLSYWQQQLNALPILALPTDYQRPPVQSSQGATVLFNLSPSLTDMLRTLSHREGVTLFMTLLAAFQTLLYRYTGQDDICIGSPFTNRNQTEIQNLIGFFVNTLVLRTNLSDRPSFLELLRRVREVCVGAYAHADLPFDQVLKHLNPERSLNHTPFFRVLFALQEDSQSDPTLPGLTLNFLPIHNKTAKFDLSLYVIDAKPKLQGFLEYSTDLFDATTITRMVKHYQTLLEEIVTNPQQRISEVPLLTASEKFQLLWEWNNTQVNYRQESIHQLFEAQVKRTPNAVAVVFEDQQLTYCELNIRANQLAHYLQKLGVGLEVLVGICLERSVEIVVGILAVLKAGGTYIPIDPTYPIERLNFILSDAQVAFIISHSSLTHLCGQITTISLDSDRKFLELESQENPVSISASNHLAYIIYTSGSTGTPKGVLGTHQGTVNGLHWLWKTYPFTNEEVCCQKTAISFVDSVWEIFAPLLQGIPTIIIPDGIVLDSQLFIETLAYYKVTRIILVPSLLRLLLDNYPHLMQNLSHLKLWITSGEALSVNLARTFRELIPSAKLLNFYGSSEVSANVTYYDTSLLPERANSVPIGRPIDNILVYILDRYLQPTPIGVVGELYIGGDGLARGYLNQPALTSEKFIPNPFGDCPGTHLYKTGDLACYLSNGEIQYIGRIDHQVKIRGFRIELGEIEAAINQHPEIQQAVVLAQEDQTGNKQLVAYVVASSQNHQSQEKLYRELIPQLRSFLESNLPNYMVPAAFVILEVLPLTPNGKIDRQALSTTDTTQIFSKSDFIPATTLIEQMLALIWEKILGIEKIGIHDNFFELGGHSLLATRVISQVRQVFQQELPLHSLFAQPTIAGLAKEIEKATKLDLGLETATIARVSHEQELPLSFAQKRLWFLVQLNPNSSLYNSSAAIRLEGQLNQAALQQSFNEIIRRHQALRTTFPVVNGQPIQVISPSATLKLPIVDLQELPEAQKKALVQKLIQEESQRCFDLVQCPLLRYTLIHTHELEYILLFTIHHIVSDGWSVGVLIKELTTLYKDFCAEQPSSLPELPIQYADFAIWQRQWLQGEVLEAQLAYWKRQLGNNLPVLQLPTTRPRAEVKTNHGSTSSFIIPIKESESLQALSRQEGVTLFMTLLAAFQILLQRYTHQDDIVVGTDIANRNRAEIEPLIGFFVNLLVLRTDLSGNPSFPELLKRVRSCTLGAYAHQDLPFEELVKALEPDRNLSNIPPLFRVLFVLQNAPIPPLELTGLTLSLLEVENKVAKFDLALFLTETESGILGKWQYNSDLFDTPTITRITGHFQTLINSIVSQPDSRINSLEMITEEERKQQAMQKRERKASNREKLISIVPQAISLSQAGLIKTTYLQPEQIFPLVIQPNTDDIDLVNWVQNNRAFLEKQLLKHGAILFRDFNINSVLEFESFAQAIYPDLFDEYGDLPRTEEGGKVYGSTPYPSDKAILFHNESSHLYQFPLKIWFFCVQPAKQGGETPIVDCRKAYQILNHNLRERLIEKQLMYIRHYTDGLDVSWQNFFRTNDKSLVENYCRRTKIDFEWYDNNSLMTRQVLPAVAIHPKSNDMVFFNQIQLHHIAYLDAEVRESLLSLFGDKQLPRNVCYGDGTPIKDDVISEINQVYQQSKTSFPWQQQDILMLDNMLTAHGRYPYIGERKIVVAMGEMIQSKDIVLHSKAGGGK